MAAVVAVVLTAGCYPRYDWRDYRPDCARAWCGFTASFPGKVTSVTRDVAIGARTMPLSFSVVSVGEITFAVGAFELRSADDGEAARAAFERKLLDDVGATDARRSPASLRAGDRSEIAAESFDAEGRRDGKALRAIARFAKRPGRVIEIVVIGPAELLATPAGRQAIETFVTSVRID